MQKFDPTPVETIHVAVHCNKSNNSRHSGYGEITPGWLQSVKNSEFEKMLKNKQGSYLLGCNKT